MKKRILVTGRLPEEIMKDLSKKYDAEINIEDKPFNRQKLLSGIKDKDGLLSMRTSLAGLID